MHQYALESVLKTLIYKLERKLTFVKLSKNLSVNFELGKN